MSNLKELTWEHLKNAERQKFVKELMGGKISNERYATYLFNPTPQYDILEAIAMMQGHFNGASALRRAPAFLLILNNYGQAEIKKDPLCPL